MITKSLHRLWQHRQPMIACLLGLSVVSGLVVASYALAQSPAAVPARLVTVVENGRERAVYSTASSVRELITASGMKIDTSHDSVSPHLDASLAQAAPTVTIQRARLVTVIDGKKRSRVLTSAQTPQDIAKAAGMTLYREDRASFQTPGNIALDGPSEMMTIHRAPTYTVTAEEPIAFATETIKDKQQFIGSKTIKRAGQPGVRRLTYTVEMKDGIEVQRRLTAQTVVKQPTAQVEVVGTKPKNPLTKSKGAHHFTDSKGVSHRETYYDLPMNVAMHNCGGGTYTIRGDGAKVDKDGYILVAANYSNYPRCSVVETSMGPGKVYDTGSFATKHPHGFDLATDWTKADGK